MILSPFVNVVLRSMGHSMLHMRSLVFGLRSCAVYWLYARKYGDLSNHADPETDKDLRAASGAVCITIEIRQFGQAAFQADVFAILVQDVERHEARPTKLSCTVPTL